MKIIEYSIHRTNCFVSIATHAVTSDQNVNTGWLRHYYTVVPTDVVNTPAVDLTIKTNLGEILDSNGTNSSNYKTDAASSTISENSTRSELTHSLSLIHI